MRHCWYLCCWIHHNWMQIGECQSSSTTSMVPSFLFREATLHHQYWKWIMFQHEEQNSSLLIHHQLSWSEFSYNHHQHVQLNHMSNKNGRSFSYSKMTFLALPIGFFSFMDLVRGLQISRRTLNLTNDWRKFELFFSSQSKYSPIWDMKPMSKLWIWI